MFYCESIRLCRGRTAPVRILCRRVIVREWRVDTASSRVGTPVTTGLVPQSVKPLMPHIERCVRKLASYFEVHVEDVAIGGSFAPGDGTTVASFRLEASAVQLKISGATVTSIAVQLSVDSFPITPCVTVEKIECQADYTFLDTSPASARADLFGISVTCNPMSLSMSSLDLSYTPSNLSVAGQVISVGLKDEVVLSVGMVSSDATLTNPEVSVCGLHVHCTSELSDVVLGAWESLQNCSISLGANPPRIQSVFVADSRVSVLSRDFIVFSAAECALSGSHQIVMRRVESILGESRLISCDFVSLSWATPSKVLVGCDRVVLSAHLPVAPFINKIVLLALDIACRLHSRSSSSRSSSSTPSLLQADLTVVVDLRSTEVAFSSVLVATMSLASITVCGKRWSLLLSQAQCRHASKTFLTANEIRFLGNPAGYASSNCVHESLRVIASHVRGTWTPALQLDMMDFIKRIVAIVIIAKFSLFQRCFGHLKLPSRPASLPAGLAESDVKIPNEFFRWAYETRAPYLQERFKFVSLSITDVVVHVALHSSHDIAIRAQQFGSAFAPYHWMLHDVGVWWNGYPCVRLDRVTVARMLGDSTRSEPVQDAVAASREFREESVSMLEYLPLRIDADGLLVKVPHDTLLVPELRLLTVQLDGLVTAMEQLPTLHQLSLGEDLLGPGYSAPPAASPSKISVHLQRGISISLMDSHWDAWISQIHHVGLDERVAAESRRELLRLKIREHQRRSGHILTDARIATMSSRLAETNFAMYKGRIDQLKEQHHNRWRFPSRENGSFEEEYPGAGDFRCGSLVSVNVDSAVISVSIIDQASHFMLPLLLPLSRVNAAFSLDVSASCLVVQLRQFSPELINLSSFTCRLWMRIVTPASLPPQLATNVELHGSSTHLYKVALKESLIPPLVELFVQSATAVQPHVSFSTDITSTLQLVASSLERFLPVFLDPALKDVNVLDLSRYLCIIREVRDIRVTDWKAQISKQTLYALASDAGEGPSLSLSGSLLAVELEVGELRLTISSVTSTLSDSSVCYDTVDASDSVVSGPDDRLLRMSPRPGTKCNEIVYDSTTLGRLQDILITVSFEIRNGSGELCTSPWQYRLEPSNASWAAFSASSIGAKVRVSNGDNPRETALAINKHMLPSLSRLASFGPPVRYEGLLASLQLCVRLHNLTLSLLDVQTDSAPGRGLRLVVGSVNLSGHLHRHPFDRVQWILRRAYACIDQLSLSLIANRSYWADSLVEQDLYGDIQEGRVVVVHTYENQRFWLGRGWLSQMLPTDRPTWSDADGNEELPRDHPAFDLPSDRHWVWEGPWKIDKGQLRPPDLGPCVDANGWEYAHDFPRQYTHKRRWTDNVRRRRWYRVRRLISNDAHATESQSRQSESRRRGGLLAQIEMVSVRQKAVDDQAVPDPAVEEDRAIVSNGSANEDCQKPRVNSLLSFFAISPTGGSKEHQTDEPEPDHVGSLEVEGESVDDASDRSHLYHIVVKNPRARMTLETRDALVVLYRSFLHTLLTECNWDPAPPTTEQPDGAISDHSNDESDMELPSYTHHDASSSSSSDDDNDNSAPVHVEDDVEDDVLSGIASHDTFLDGSNADESVNAVSLLDLVSIDLVRLQLALESTEKTSNPGVLFFCASQCLVNMRTLAPSDDIASPESSLHIDLRILIEKMTFRLAPTDIDVDAGITWCLFDSLQDNLLKPILEPVPVQASAALALPLRSSQRTRVCMLLPSLKFSLDAPQLTLVSSIVADTLLTPLPASSASTALQESYAVVAAARADRRRLLWQIRQLEWLMGVFHETDGDDNNGNGAIDELALLEAHSRTLHEQFEAVDDVVVRAQYDMFRRIRAEWTTSCGANVDLQIRIETIAISLMSPAMTPFVTASVPGIFALIAAQLHGEGSASVSMEINDITVYDDDLNEFVVSSAITKSLQQQQLPLALDSGSHISDNAVHDSHRRVVFTLQAHLKRVGGIVVISSAVGNLAHLTVSLTQSLIEALISFFSATPMSLAERRILQGQDRFVPSAQGVLGLAEVAHIHTPSSASTSMSSPAHSTQLQSPRDRDQALMDERSATSIIITYLRIGTIRLTVNYRGNGSMADFQGLCVRLPPLVYQRKTWTVDKFLARFKRDLIRALLSQVGPSLAGIVRYKFGGNAAEDDKKRQKPRKQQRDSGPSPVLAFEMTPTASTDSSTMLGFLTSRPQGSSRSGGHQHLVGSQEVVQGLADRHSRHEGERQVSFATDAGDDDGGGGGVERPAQQHERRRMLFGRHHSDKQQ
ncbi:hypothetical protein PBRA_007561 [Plasmodiophora brassicae]|uniref:Peroxin/Ferlin domain-containing protein n=1 Tax=Plasmodiophora brassicae TaxID=37360 RepID=A0A0G4IX44_PLABS|nr:hypothetical protein PBRA_007561 [Plasmodiophora brassicae]